jgi:broad specificity phosphatase PhoE
MKPKRIILVRHGESESNVDKDILKQKPDFAVNLTLKGREAGLTGARSFAAWPRK